MGPKNPTRFILPLFITAIFIWSGVFFVQVNRHSLSELFSNFGSQPALVAGGLLFQGNFEADSTSSSASISGWNQWGPNDNAIVVTTEQARAGSKSVKFDFSLSDWNATDTNHNQRAEITQVNRTEFKLGQTYWVGFSQFVPTTWQNDLATNSELIWQFHGWDDGPGSLSPPLALYIRGNNESLEVRYATTTADGSPSSKSKVLASMPIDPDKGQWIDWVIQVNFNFQGGMIKAWKNGVKVVDYQGSTIYHMPVELNQNGPYIHFGVYKWYWGSTTTQVSNRTLYTDEIRFGDSTATCDDVKPTSAVSCIDPDVTSPTVLITSPINAETVSGIVSVNASATDDRGVSRVEFYTNDTLFSIDAVAPYSALWDTSALLPQSSYTLTAKAYDAAENSATSSAVTVVVVAPPPLIVSITSPLDTATVSGNVAVNATTSGSSAISKVDFYVDGGLVSSDTTTPYSYTWNTSSYVHNSDHSLFAKSYDTAGNVGTSASLSVKVADITTPITTITSPINNAIIPRNSTVTIQASASDISGISKVEFRVNNILKCTDTTAPYSCSWSVPGQKNVVYTLQSRAYDVVNNSAVSSNVTVTAK